MRVPLVDDEGLRAGAAEVQQGARDQRADGGRGEGAEGDLQRPRDSRDLLEHVDDAADGRVEEHGHAAGPAHRADDALRVREALLVDEQRRGAARAGGLHVYPLPHVGQGQDVSDEEGEVAPHGDGGALAAHGVASGVREDRGEGAGDEVAPGEEPRDAVAVEPALVLRRPGAARVGRHEGHEARGDGGQRGADAQQRQRTQQDAPRVNDGLHGVELPLDHEGYHPDGAEVD
mmetsp:Transcript_5906/g.18270  ORF Transcript_5906/g.18270 Transcript_5906/m.18270 type:complete len:232 (-) Transcript_5906:300-995(-)